MPRILVVDDDDGMRRILVVTLEQLGHEVCEAANGARAFIQLRGATFDLVITDLIMPDMEGIELITEIRNRPSPPKIIAISGGGRGRASDYLQLAKALGAEATLAKPFARDALVTAIAKVLE